VHPHVSEISASGRCARPSTSSPWSREPPMVQPPCRDVRPARTGPSVTGGQLRQARQCPRTAKWCGLIANPKRDRARRDRPAKSSSGASNMAPHSSQTRCPWAPAARWYVAGPCPRWAWTMTPRRSSSSRFR